MPSAWVLKEIGDIIFAEVEKPVPKAGEVLIRVMSAGICGSDVPRVYETGAHRMPIIPGHEFSGVVEEAGEGADTDWIGKRVAVFPKIACGKCEMCKTGKPEMCRNYDYTGSRRDGAFAEYVMVPASNLLEIPDTVSFEDAAMFEPLGVAANAVRTGIFNYDISGVAKHKGSITDGEISGNALCNSAAPDCEATGIHSSEVLSRDSHIAVCGMGTIGLMVVMLLKDAGYDNISVIGNKEPQMQRACALGVPEERFCNSGKENVREWFSKCTEGSADLFFECVGRNECITYGIEVLAPCGKMILVGNPYSDMILERNVYWKVLRDQLSLKGIWNSRFSQTAEKGEAQDDWHYVLERVKNGLKPSDLISHRFGRDGLEKGLLIMRDKKEDYCKVMINFNT